MPFLKVGSLADLTPGSVMEAVVDGRRVAVCNTGEALHAVDAICPHAGGPLAHGALHEHMLVCPYHAWEFDCRTGEHDYNPAVKLDTFAVKAEGDDILVDVNTSA
jgi:nitrite reductase (NADH) small subunit